MSEISGMIGVVGKVALLRQLNLFMGNEESGNGMRGGVPLMGHELIWECTQAGRIPESWKF